MRRRLHARPPCSSTNDSELLRTSDAARLKRRHVWVTTAGGAMPQATLVIEGERSGSSSVPCG